MANVSVIVPVYNVERYLAKCIDSILGQSYSNIELIMVDDGSSDNSGKICEEYAAKDSRIRVFHKENGGVSSARNVGLDNANGKWVIFVDADDWLHNNAIEECMRYSREADIIRFSMRLIEKEDESKIHDVIIRKEDRLTYLSKLLSRDTILGICGGMYKTELFINNNLRFRPDLTSGEDWVVLTSISSQANVIEMIEEPLYFYNKYNETSCTSSFKFRNHFSAMKALQMVSDFVKRKISAKVFEDCQCSAKCNLIYDYAASTIANHVVMNRDLLKEYRECAALSFVEIIKGTRNMKMLLILLLYYFRIIPFHA